MTSGCSLPALLLLARFLKTHPLPSWCEKDATSMMTELAALTFSSKAVRVGSSCSLEKQGVTVTPWARKGVGEHRMLQLTDHLRHLRGYVLGTLCPSYSCPQYERGRGSTIQNPTTQQEALGVKELLDVTGKPGHVSPLQYTHDQQFKGWGSRISGQQLLKTSLLHTKHLLL